MKSQLQVVCLVTALIAQIRSDELWRDDLSRKMNIGITASGFDKVWLDCLQDSMDVTIQMSEDFQGVVYTRGSFYSRDPQCFLDANGGRRFRMKLPFDQCKIENNGDMYKVTLIVQHDKELIMPGDGAFALECNLKAKDSRTSNFKVKSSISLADPDPSGKDVPTHLKSTVTGEKSVMFTPSDIRPRKSPLPREEL